MPSASKLVPVVLESFGKLTIATDVVDGVNVVVAAVEVDVIGVTGIVVETVVVVWLVVVVNVVVDVIGKVMVVIMFVVDEMSAWFVVVERLSSEEETDETATKSVFVSTLTVVESTNSSLEKKNSNFTLMTGYTVYQIFRKSFIT